MPLALTLLDGVRWHGKPVVGDRPQALLAALAAGGGRAVANERLVEAVWGDDVPANAGKALQVLVSRTRAVCSADVVAREGHGYRLAVPREQVDSFLLNDLVDSARKSLSNGDGGSAIGPAVEAAELVSSLAVPDDDEDGPIADLRRAAMATATEGSGLLGRALSASGNHAGALPRLEEAFDRNSADESLLAALLGSEAAVRGTGAALDRYEHYRIGLRDRLGADPGSALQRVHRDLLAQDRPVREGIRYDTTTLLGRKDDINRLRALVNGARVVSIVGPGGLGKTRLAHVLGRETASPVVHFVELVGVTVPEDLVGEVGSALGVRDSVSARRALTPEQRADVRSRIAQHLGQSPSLLILDNCEHIVEAVADLVAFLVATTQDLRVITTTRAPLAISAERVYLLGELDTKDAVELFRQRAVAARPDVALDDTVVADIVTRLDGLPLAIELAAAKVRVMSTEDISRRLENRFALLRGGDRSAPDRHQTLIAVIDWSWNLLEATERRALRWLSVFHDGFTLDAAEVMLGSRALDAVQSLADQSLLSVSESSAGVRYRMLETVREFGRMQLVDAGEDEQAKAAQRSWATAYAHHHGSRLFGPEEFGAMDALAVEASNLADVLRQALAEPDPEAVIHLLSGVGAFWSVRGDHGRLIVLVEATVEALTDWVPPPELEDLTRIVAVLVLNNAMILVDQRINPIRDLLARLGPGKGNDPRVSAMTRVMLEYDPDSPAEFFDRLDELSKDPDRFVATTALQWNSHARENAGDPEGAVDAAERGLALITPADGPWAAAILRTQLAQLTMQLGHHDVAAIHAAQAVPVLQRLGASDDLAQLRSLLAMSAVSDGRLDDAAEELDRIGLIDEHEVIFGGGAVVQIGQAELALAKGDHATGLAVYLDVIDRMEAVAIPGIDMTGMEPWVQLGIATAVTAYALYAGPEDMAKGAELFEVCCSRVGAALSADHPYLDYPVAGLVLFAVGAWGLLRDALPPADAVRLLVLAERFAYNRMVPTMAWENIEPHAERLAPGRIAVLREEYGDRRGPELLDEGKAFLEELFG